MSLLVLDAGRLTTIQDAGRHGWAHLGVPTAGPLDRPAAQLANRLVGNHPGAAVLEVLLGGLACRLGEARWVAVTGAPAPVSIAGRPAAYGEAVWVPAGAELRLGQPDTGMRSYLAVAGGIEVEPALGSRSTDTLAHVGPPVVESGVELPVGRPHGQPVAVDVPGLRRTNVLRVHSGPEVGWLTDSGREALFATGWTVSADSDRVGLRLAGPALERSLDDELPSEGMVTGSVQVPGDGRPVVFLADHPPTGGYPVVAVVDRRDLWMCAQARPGERLQLSRR